MLYPDTETLEMYGFQNIHNIHQHGLKIQDEYEKYRDENPFQVIHDNIFQRMAQMQNEHEELMRVRENVNAHDDDFSIFDYILLWCLC
jgi:hypothetical protein